MSYKIAPSILAADYANFASELARIVHQVRNMFTLILWMVNLFLISVGEQMWLLACVNIAS